jgi:NADPH-dependent ferric siderophore reductase
MLNEPSDTNWTLQAQADVDVADPEALIEQVFAHFAEHDAEICPCDNGALAKFFFGEGSMQVRSNRITMKVRAEDLSRLAFMKQFFAGHLVEFAEGSRPRFVWTGDGADIKTFPNLHEMTIERITDLTPRMRRITLTGPGLERYPIGGLHLKLIIPPEGTKKPEWPVPGEDGIAIWPADTLRPLVRTYTARRVDLAAGSVDVDFVLHGDHSIGSRWASNARVGDVVGVRGPVGRPVPEADWYLLVGDETALPAIARTLEALAEGTKGVAIIEVADEGEMQPINHRTDIDIQWLLRSGAEAGTTSLLIDAVRRIKMPPAGVQIHALAGVEYTASKAIRRYWLDELKLDRKAVLPVAYWRQGCSEDGPRPDESE